MTSAIVMVCLGVVACVAGVLAVRFRRRMTSWQNYMNSQFGWNPRGRRRFVTIGQMTVIGCAFVITGLVFVVNGAIRLLA